MGYYYENGVVVRKDTAKAAQCYEEAAKNGNTNAMYKLGLCYASGVGVPQDYERAARWHDAALKGGFKDTNIDLKTY